MAIRTEPAQPPSRTTQPARTPTVVEVPSLSSDDLIPALQQQLHARGYRADEVLIRSFDRERLPLMLETGTDRDDGSSTFSKSAKPGEFIAGADASPDDRQRDGVSPGQVTYAHRLTWKGADPQFL